MVTAVHSRVAPEGTHRTERYAFSPRYYRARYYGLHLGRFISEDPLKFSGSANFFGYVRNNLPNFIDPLGLMACIKTQAGLVCWSDKRKPITIYYPEGAPTISQNIASEYDAYKQCTGPELWKECTVSMPNVPYQDVTKDDPFGTNLKEPPMNLAPIQADLAKSKAKECLRHHPLAALDSRFNDISPADLYK